MSGVEGQLLEAPNEGLAKRVGGLRGWRAAVSALPNVPANSQRGNNPCATVCTCETMKHINAIRLVK